MPEPTAPAAAVPPGAASRVLRRTAGVLLACLVTLALVLSTGTPAEAAKRRKVKVVGWYEMPFPCGQAWTGTTRSSHSPNSNSIDWNRTDDVDDAVVAAAGGIVQRAYTKINGGYGKWVQIGHPGNESTLYAHLNSVAVTVGQAVDQGTVIGTLGSTGNSTGPHLHFEERAGSVVAPAKFARKKFEYGSTKVSTNCVDYPLAGNFLGTAAAELAVFRRTARASFLVRGGPTITYGNGSDDPVVGDWDGDGYVNVGVRRAAESTFYLSLPAGTVTVPFGDPTDRPVAGDWNGDRVDDIGVWRSATASFHLRLPDGGIVTVALGDANDLPVTGDWNGDGIDDIGVFDQASAVFTLRTVASGVAWTTAVPFGAAYDLPVVGDWDGNGASDLGVWRPTDATFYNRPGTGVLEPRRRILPVVFGRPRPGL